MSASASHPPVRGLVVGSLQRGTIDVHLAYGFVMNDGGRIQRLPIEHFPQNCQLPNVLIWYDQRAEPARQIKLMCRCEAEGNQFREIQMHAINRAHRCSKC